MTTPPARGIDLGWCICRKLSREASYKIANVQTYPRIQATLAAYAGLTRHQFKKLPPERVEELWQVHLWMMRPFDRPMVGKIVEL